MCACMYVCINEWQEEMRGQGDVYCIWKKRQKTDRGRMEGGIRGSCR